MYYIAAAFLLCAISAPSEKFNVLCPIFTAIQAGEIQRPFPTPRDSFSGPKPVPDTPVIAQTTMLSPLPPEILDLIVDFLHDEPDALRACCLVSRSWVHRTQEHLFAHVEFLSRSHTILWKEMFPDPSNSPARHTRSLLIRESTVVAFVDTDVGDWARAFDGVVRLDVDICGFGSGRKISLVQLHGLSPTLKSLRLAYESSAPSSEILSFVCSFPLLEDLALVSLGGNSEIDEWNIPSTSPKFTGYLDLRMLGGTPPVVHRLLELPNGLHFSKISVACSGEDVGSMMMNLVSECSDTLEYLSIYYYIVGAVFLSAFMVGQYVNTIFWRIVEHSMPLLDLSKLTKLKDVVFGCTGPEIQRITMTLQTAESINLEQITIHSPTSFKELVVESDCPGWQDLDRLLLRFWTSHSIRPKIWYKDGEEEYDLRYLVPRIFPELTSRGLVDLIEYDWTFRTAIM